MSKRAFSFKEMRIFIQTGELSNLYSDAIVRLTDQDVALKNEYCQKIVAKGGRAVIDSAIRRGPLGAGEALVTFGGGLLAKYVIHVALHDLNMVLQSKGHPREDILSKGLLSCMQRAEELLLIDIGMPDISRQLNVSYMRLKDALKNAVAAFLANRTTKHLRDLVFVFDTVEACEEFSSTLERDKELQQLDLREL